MPFRAWCRLVPLIAAAFFLAVAAASFAQDGSVVPAPPGSGTAEGATAESGPQAGSSGDEEADLVRKTMALDIATSSFYELADWLRSLGLSDSGSAAELRSRLYAHYGVEAPGAAPGGRIITIERAASADYFRIEGEEGPIIRVSGGVILTFKDEGKGESHRLEADEVVFDKARNAVSARGNVSYRRVKGSEVEEFHGDSLNVDLDDWAGVFLDGKLRRSAQSGSGAKDVASAVGLSPSDRGFSFEAETIVKRSGNLLILDNGVISACDEASPHFSVRAKRLWLLASNEWALSDAVLSLGEVPLLWIPFFYYPGEEIVFHPVLGYREREGRFFQSTTYIIGSKAQSQGSSILSLAQAASGEETKVRGVFLRPVEGSTKKATTDEASLRLLADVYSGLGAYLGLSGEFPKAGAFKNLKFSAATGLSRSIFSTSSGYSPYSATGGWASVWNSSSLLGASLPLRWGADFSTGLTLGDLGLSFALPFYSDPYFNDDFGDRSEDMDWIGISAAASTTSTSSTVTSFTQKASLTWSLKPAGLSPWISSIDVTKLSASLAWLSKQNEDLKASESSGLFNVDPSRTFFYPNLMRPLEVALSLKGKLLPSGSPASPAAEGGTAEGTGLKLRSPWEGEDGEKKESKPAGSQDFRLSGRLPSFPAAAAAPANGGLSLDWSLEPSAYIEDRFLSASWSGPSDVSMSDLLYSLASWRLASSINAGFSPVGDLFTASLGLNWGIQDQYRTTTTDSAYSGLVASYRLSDWQYRFAKLGSTLKLQAKPFSGFWLLSPTTLSYNLDGILYEYLYTGLDGSSDPVYESLHPAWDSSMITTHAASASLGLRTGASVQSLGLTLSLPPTTESYAASLSLAAVAGGFKAALTAKTRMYRPISQSDFSFDPVSASLTLGGPGELSLTDSLTWDPATSLFKTNITTFGWGPLSAVLEAKRGYYYSLDPLDLAAGWQQVGSEAFVVSNFKAAFKKTWKTADSAPWRASLSVDASYNQSLLQFSDSVLGLSLGLTLKINGFLDLSFSSVSQNASAWRYCPWLFPAVYDIGDPASWFKNPVTDIADSFAFWDKALRTASLFKLKSLSVSLVHDLHDWDLSFTLTASPVLDTTAKAYVLDSNFTVLLKWKDLPQIKSTLTKSSSGYSF